MRRLQEKLKSQNGASILLALLFFLLCGMVGASILMASVSNAGKLRSNQTEQQKYLALSSALRLVCGEIAELEYYGKYEYRTWTEEKILPGVVNPDGSPATEPHTYHEYKQKVGDFAGGNLHTVLPLCAELDILFGKTFPSGNIDSTEHYMYIKLDGVFDSMEHNHTLTLTVGPDTLEGLDQPVTVLVRMDEHEILRLSASLGEPDETGYVYKMEAQMSPGGTEPKFPDSPGSEDGKTYTIGPRTWTLEWIAKKEAGDGG